MMGGLSALSLQAEISSPGQVYYQMPGALQAQKQLRVPWDLCQLSASSVLTGEKLQRECRISQQYQRIKADLAQMNLGVENVTQYQLLRFTQRSWLEIAKLNNQLPDYIYQPLKSDYSKPLNERSTLIWDNWTLAMSKQPERLQQVLSGEAWSLPWLLAIHRDFYPLYPWFDESGDFAHQPYPGVLKPTIEVAQQPLWWEFKGSVSERDELKARVENAQARYQALGLVTPAPFYLPKWAEYIFDLRPLDHQEPQNGFGVFQGHSAFFRENTERLLAFITRYYQKIKGGRLEEGDMTPVEFAFFVQQYFVRLHPFHEGNGRTSRYLQELILLSFGWPHGPSGDLMDIDVFEPDPEYYQKAMIATQGLLEDVSKCGEQYTRVLNKSKVRVVSTDPLQARDWSVFNSHFEYACRILEPPTQRWEQWQRLNLAQPDKKAKEQELDLLHEQWTQDHNRILRIRNARVKAHQKP